MLQAIMALFMVVTSYSPRERLIPKVPLLQDGNSRDSSRLEYYA